MKSEDATSPEQNQTPKQNAPAEHLEKLIQDNPGCNEIIFQFVGSALARCITSEAFKDKNINIEKLCRQFTNQDIVIKIRNGKKVSIERTHIIKP
jgi:hypothetical protein